MTLQNSLSMPQIYLIYGHFTSFFTRKLMGHMTYKGLPWMQGKHTWPDHVLASAAAVCPRAGIIRRTPPTPVRPSGGSYRPKRP